MTNCAGAIIQCNRNVNKNIKMSISKLMLGFYIVEYKKLDIWNVEFKQLNSSIV